MKTMLMHSFLQGFQDSFRLALAIPGAIFKAVVGLSDLRSDADGKHAQHRKIDKPIRPDSTRKKTC